jgi:hypothetical protein
MKMQRLVLIFTFITALNISYAGSSNFGFDEVETGTEKLMRYFCGKILNINSYTEVQKNSLNKEYDICRLHKQLTNIPKYQLTRDRLELYYKLPKKEQRQIEDRIFYKFLISNKVLLNPIEARVLTYHIKKITRKARYGLSSLRPFDKMKIGHRPWDQKYINHKQKMKMVVALPKKFRNYKVYEYDKILEITSLSRASYLYPDNQPFIPQPEKIAFGYFEDIIIQRTPASFTDYFSLQLNDFTLKIHLLKQSLKIEKKPKVLIYINQKIENFSKQKNKLEQLK